MLKAKKSNPYALTHSITLPKVKDLFNHIYCTRVGSHRCTILKPYYVAVINILMPYIHKVRWRQKLCSGALVCVGETC